jgi:DNA-binding MarR family transcriptional regulator
VNLPEYFFTKQLTSTEFRVLATLLHVSRNSVADISLDELGLLTDLKREALRRAIRGLEGHGVLRTERRKRNLGYKSYNRYFVGEHLENEALVEEEQCLEKEASTVDCLTIDSVNYLTVVKKNTSYSFAKTGGKMHYTRGEDTSGDDNIGGFGLFEEEVAKPKGRPVSKKDPNTRLWRSEEEWTPTDVAYEFTRMLAKKNPMTPGLVNANKLAGALRGYRAKGYTTAVIELALVRQFFEDPYNYRDALENSGAIIGRFLNTFKTDLSQVGVSEVSDIDEFVYASDGRQFDNSIAGRKSMQRHEERAAQNDV